MPSELDKMLDEIEKRAEKSCDVCKSCDSPLPNVFRLVAALKLAINEYAFDADYKDGVIALEWKLAKVLKGEPYA